MSGHQRTRESITVRSLLISFGTGLAIAAAMLFIGGLPENGTEVFWKKLCDACTVPGVLLTGMGILSLVSERGAFDGLSFMTKKAFSQVLSEKRREAMPKTYYDYVSVREEKGRKKNLSTLLAGLFFLIAASVLLAVYLAKYPV